MTKRRRLPKFCVEYKDRHGKLRVYVRPPGQASVKLEGLPWSAPFMEAYAAAFASAPPNPGIKLARSGTFRWLCEQYFSSPNYTRLDDKTRRVRRQILEKVCESPIKPDSSKLAGDCPVTSFTSKLLRALRDRAIKNGRGSEAANGIVKAVRQVFSFGVEAEHCERNIARDVSYIQPDNVEGYHAWTLAEVEQFERRHPIGSKARLALGLLLYTCQRRSDVIRLGKSNEIEVTPDDPSAPPERWLRFTQWKNRKRKPIRLDIPIVPELLDLLAKSPVGKDHYLVNEFGRPFTAPGFGNWFRDRCVEAGVPGRAHGLRKASAARMADDGRTTKQIMAITGHRTEKEVTRYTRSAEQRTLARAALIPNNRKL